MMMRRPSRTAVGDAETGILGMAGLQAVDLIQCGRAAIAVALFDAVPVNSCSKWDSIRETRSAARQDLDVPAVSSGWVGPAGGVSEVAAGRADLLGLLVHALGERFVAAGEAPTTTMQASLPD